MSPSRRQPECLAVCALQRCAPTNIKGRSGGSRPGLPGVLVPIDRDYHRAFSDLLAAEPFIATSKPPSCAVSKNCSMNSMKLNAGPRKKLCRDYFTSPLEKEDCDRLRRGEAPCCTFPTLCPLGASISNWTGVRSDLVPPITSRHRPFRARRLSIPTIQSDNKGRSSTRFGFVKRIATKRFPPPKP